ncbi:MAG: Hpt domain-containing protein [Alphaproteobacteria bacterium]|nr:MAG: Hpt domain-containing protein [Alphaproteobacteria bacterium]
MGEPESLPSFDLDHFAKAVGGDRRLMTHFAAIFVANATRYVTQMHGAIGSEKGRGGAWYGVAHKLKGSASAVGAHRLAALCATAEPLPPAGDARAQALSAIKDELDRLKHVMTDLMPQTRK